MSDQEDVVVQSPKADSGQTPEGSEDRTGRKVQAGRKKPRVLADGPSCPICGKPWDDHTQMAMRDCTAIIEQAIKLAERARIRARLN